MLMRSWRPHFFCFASLLCLQHWNRGVGGCEAKSGSNISVYRRSTLVFLRFVRRSVFKHVKILPRHSGSSSVYAAPSLVFASKMDPSYMPLCSCGRTLTDLWSEGERKVGQSAGRVLGAQCEWNTVLVLVPALSLAEVPPRPPLQQRLVATCPVVVPHDGDRAGAALHCLAIHCCCCCCYDAFQTLEAHLSLDNEDVSVGYQSDAIVIPV